MRFGGKSNSVWFTFLKNLRFSAGYALLTIAAWYCSKDQWYLPAGIRLAALMFLPYRLWPFVFLGDAGALLWLRLPMAEKYTIVWSVVSPFLLAPIVSLVPLYVRRRVGGLTQKEILAPAVAGVAALWAALTGTVVNYFLGGPIASVTAQNLVKLSIGYYLGTLMIVLPVLIWLRHRSGAPIPNNLVRDGAVGVGVVALLTLLVFAMPSSEREFRQSLLILMLVPAAALTFLHGWRGATVGILAVNLGIAVTAARVIAPGAYDPQAFVAQQALAAATTILFALGSIISQHSRKAHLLGLDKEQALKLARDSFLVTERKLRSRVLLLGQIQGNLTQARRDMIRWLRENGHHADAMAMTRSSVLEARMFDDHMEALYPIGIEREGLYVALRADALSALWGQGIDVSCRLRGKPKRLGVGLQLAAYRCVCDAIAILADEADGRIKVRARTWQRASTRGIVLTVMTTAKRNSRLSSGARQGASDIDSRVEAHGGIVRWENPSKVSVLMVQDADPDAYQRLVDETEKNVLPSLPVKASTSAAAER